MYSNTGPNGSKISVLHTVMDPEVIIQYYPKVIHVLPSRGNGNIHMMVSECYGSEQESQRGASDNAVAFYATYICPVR